MTDLSDEQRQQIYEEEKARHKARKRIEAEGQHRNGFSKATMVHFKEEETDI